MDPESMILIDEMIIPNQGADWRATQIDLTMMASLAGVERTEKQWSALVDKAELKINKIYNTELNDSLIVAVPK